MRSVQWVLSQVFLLTKKEDCLLETVNQSSPCLKISISQKSPAFSNGNPDSLNNANNSAAKSVRICFLISVGYITFYVYYLNCM